MASAGGYSSTFGFLVFIQELAALGYFCVHAGRTVDSEGDEPIHAEVASADEKFANEEERLDDDTRFLFDVVARQNESMVQRIDALDNGLIAVAVGIIAVTLFVADKWFDFDPNFRFAGIIVLIESAICALFGYLTIYFVGRGGEDVVRLGDFAADFSESRAKATFSAISNITRSGKTNLVLRRYKRAYIIIATLLVIGAAGIVVAGRALSDSGP